MNVFKYRSFISMSFYFKLLNYYLSDMYCLFVIKKFSRTYIKHLKFKLASEESLYLFNASLSLAFYLSMGY
jgi:hypothetical protein